MPRAARHPCPPPWSVAWRLWVVLFQEGLCESWLVEAPQCQTYCDHQPRRNVANLIITVPAGIDEHSAEGIQLFLRLLIKPCRQCEEQSPEKTPSGVP